MTRWIVGLSFVSAVVVALLSIPSAPQHAEPGGAKPMPTATPTPMAPPVHATPAFAALEPRPNETKRSLETRRTIVQEYLQFVLRAGLNDGEEQRVRQILADAQLQLGHRLQSLVTNNRLPHQLDLLAEVQAFEAEYRERLLQVLTPEQYQELRRTVGDAERIAWARPF